MWYINNFNRKLPLTSTLRICSFVRKWVRDSTLTFTIICIAVFSSMVFSSCDKEDTGPWAFDLSGCFHCRGQLENLGIVIFNLNGIKGDGLCLPTLETPLEQGIPFKFKYVRDNKNIMNSKVIIISDAQPADYPEMNEKCIAFHPGEYTVSPSTKDSSLICIENNIIWSIYLDNQD